MVEDLETEVTDLLVGRQPDEVNKSLKEERDKREKLEAEKKKLESQLADLSKKTSESSSVKTWREKCEKLEKEKSELAAKMESKDLVDLDTLQQVRQEKHKLQKEVRIVVIISFFAREILKKSRPL